MFEELNEELCLLTGQELPRPKGLSLWDPEDVHKYFDSDGSQLPAELPADEARLQCAALTQGQRRWTVIHGPRVAVRAEGSRSSKMVGSRAVGDEVVADCEANGWVRIAGTTDWMLVDGAEIGLGRLLEPQDEEIVLRVLHPESTQFLGEITVRTHCSIRELRDELCQVAKLQSEHCVLCRGVMGERVADSGDSVLPLDSAVYEAGWRSGDAPGYFYFGQAQPAAPAVPEPDMLAMKHWAVVGDHANNAICARLVARLEQCGKLVHKVNPYAGEKLCDIGASVEVVDLVVNPFFGEQIIQDCNQLSIQKVFIQPGACSAEILNACASHGIEARQGCVLTCHFPH